MPTIQVDEPFVLNLDDGTQRDFRSGLFEVEQEIADHWYVKAKSKPYEGEAAAPASDGEPAQEATQQVTKDSATTKRAASRAKTADKSPSSRRRTADSEPEPTPTADKGKKRAVPSKKR
jgi:hypothetical protein